MVGSCKISLAFCAVIQFLNDVIWRVCASEKPTAMLYQQVSCIELGIVIDIVLVFFISFLTSIKCSRKI